MKAWAVFRPDGRVVPFGSGQTRALAIGNYLVGIEQAWDWPNRKACGYTVRKVTITEGWPPALNMPHARLDAATIAGNDAGEMED